MNVSRHCCILLLLLLPFWLAGCSSESVRPEPLPLRAGVPELPLETVWSRRFIVDEDGIEGLGSHGVPVVTPVADRILVVIDSDLLLLNDAGETVWQTALKLENKLSAQVADGIAADKSMVVVATLDGEVMALAVDDGALLWRQPMPGEVLSPPVLQADKIFVHTSNGQLIALDRQTGKRLWVYSEILPTLTLRGTSPPLAIGDKVLAGFANGRLLALDGATGSLLWVSDVGTADGRTVLARMADIDAALLVIDGVVYSSAYQRRLVAASLLSGRILWSRDISTHLDIASDDRYLFLVGDQGQISAVDRLNGEIIWRQDQLKYRRLSRPQVFAGRLLLADASGYLHALSLRDGSLLGRYRFSSEQEGAPVLKQHEDALLLREYNGRLSRLILTEK